MKVIKYNLRTRVNRGTEDEPVWENVLNPAEMDWNETNEEIAKRESHNGEYTIEGEDDRVEPTQLDRIEAQVVYTAMMTDTLLEV
jgi:hypothetical protein